MMRYCVVPLGALIMPALVAGHGSMIMPASRNSVDADPGMPWADGKFPETGLIEPYTCHCVNGTDKCSAGQSCFWCVGVWGCWGACLLSWALGSHTQTGVCASSASAPPPPLNWDRALVWTTQVLARRVDRLLGR